MFSFIDRLEIPNVDTAMPNLYQDLTHDMLYLSIYIMTVGGRKL